MQSTSHPNNKKLSNNSLQDNTITNTSSTNINETFNLFAVTGEEIRFKYLADQRKVEAYVIDPNDNKSFKLIRNEDMLKELKAVGDPATLKSFIENAYPKVITLDKGDVKLYVNQRVVGGGKEENTKLLLAARDGKVEEVKALLEKGADVNAKDNNGRIALHLAAANEKVSTIAFLLNLGTISIDVKDNNGDTALHRAANNGYLKSIELLLNKGADLTLKNDKDQTVLDLANISNKKEVAGYIEARSTAQEKVEISKEKVVIHTDTSQSEETAVKTTTTYKLTTDKPDKREEKKGESKGEKKEEGVSRAKSEEEAGDLLQASSSTTSSSASFNPSPLVPLTVRLKALYRAQDTLPKLIEDASVPEQKIDDYYIKLQIVLKDKKSGDEKQPIVLSQMFEQVEKQEAVGKVLVTGVAGIGKTSLLGHISYEWSKGNVFAEKFENVFKIRLKSLLDEGLAAEVGAYAKKDMLPVFIQRSIL